VHDVFIELTLILAVTLAVMAAAYVMGVRRRDLGWVDIGWASGVGLGAGVAAITLDGAGWRRAAVFALAAVWSGRLVWHMWRHRVNGRGEDARYQALREHWGERVKWYAPLLFLAEAPLAALFALFIAAAMRATDPVLRVWDLLGLAIGVVAIVGEHIADRQLESFRSDARNRGRTCRVGLWRASRHPNYFFEWLHWWAYVALAAGAPGGAITILGPALMLLFLFRITGIPHTERRALATRGEDYRRYQQTTSVFVPWFPGKGSEP
jgi:steroid 5-alpha reductase family enzyme